MSVSFAFVEAIRPRGIQVSERHEGSWVEWLLLEGRGKRAVLGARTLREGLTLIPDPTDELLVRLRQAPNDARSSSLGAVGYVNDDDVSRWFETGEVPDNGYGAAWACFGGPYYDSQRAGDPRAWRRRK